MTTPTYLLRIVTPSGTTSVELTNPTTLGREGTDVVLDDPAVSRAHLSVEGAGAQLLITDLGSSNGTYVSGARISGPTTLTVGDAVTLGDSTVTFVEVTGHGSDPRATAAPHTNDGAQTPDPDRAQEAPQVEPAPSAPPSASPAGLAHSPSVNAGNGPSLAYAGKSLISEAVELRFAEGSYGQEIAKSYAATAARARKRLAGLGSEPWGALPVVHLIDPYHDNGEVVTSGAVIDAARGEAWVVATPEAPPEDPHRLLAVLFGAALPSAEELAFLIEGYGLHKSGLPDPDETLSEMGVLPPIEGADGETRGLMAMSFVRFLVGKENEAAVIRLLGAPDGRVEETCREVFGSAMAQLEDAWRRKTLAGESDVKTGDFLRLSLKYLKPYKLRQAEIFAYMLLSLAFTAAFPFVTQRLFDTALPSGEFSQVMQLLIALAIAFVISLVAGVRQAYQTAWVSGAVTRDIRQSMFAHVQRLPASWFHNHPQGDVLSRLFSDVGAVQSGLSEAIGQGIFQMISLVVTAGIMLTINLWLGIVVLLAAPLVGLVYRNMAAGAQERSLAMQENHSALLSMAAENYSANPVVKVFGLAGREERRFEQQGNRVFRSMRRLQLWGGLFGLSVNLIVTLLRLGVLGFGAWLILEGDFTTGGLVAFLAIMGEVLAPVTVLVGLSQEIQTSMGSLVRINEVMDAPLEPGDEDLPVLAPMSRELRLAGVGLSYTPERRALDEFDATIEAGTRVAFVGPSGSGKSTVLRLLMRMYEPDEGAILIDGVDVRTGSMRSWREQLGVVFQDSFLFDATLRENIAYGRAGATDADIEAAAQAAEIDTFIDSLPNGYNSLVGEGGSNLSGGQRQRVAIARALVRNPQILVLDEATSALDPATERQINDTIGRIAKGRTVVAVTHRLASITDYDRIFVIVDGRLAEFGAHDELVEAGGAYARLWAEQTGTTAPEAEPFDAVAALRRVPFLANVSAQTIDRLVERFDAFGLEGGRTLDEGSGFVLVAEGTGEVLAPSGVATATLRAGDAFGVGSALGAPATATLRASDHMSLLAISAQDLAEAADLDPSLAAKLSGDADVDAPSSGGVRLTRMTLSAPIPAVKGTTSASRQTQSGTLAGATSSATRATGAFPRLS